ncbi:hypothetical protein CB1_001086055 [Camelus ferus]|nr:hypothetical protein CB1_001086055 [Camelus ferus]
MLVLESSQRGGARTLTMAGATHLGSWPCGAGLARLRVLCVELLCACMAVRVHCGFPLLEHCMDTCPDSHTSRLRSVCSLCTRSLEAPRLPLTLSQSGFEDLGSMEPRSVGIQDLGP